MAGISKSERGKQVVPANYEAQLQQEVEAIRKRISAPTGDRIKTNGSKSFITPDGMEGTELSVVIVDFVSVNHYYDSPYDRDTPGAPACFAIGPEPSILIASPNSPSKQAESCAVCAQNQFGSASNGKGKACRNTRLLALVAAGEEATVGGDEQPIWLLSVPPTSLKSFDAYVGQLAGKFKVPPIGVVTSVTMDASIQFTNLKFGMTRALSPKELQMYMERRQEAQLRLMQEPDISQYQPPRAAKRPGVR